VRLIPKSQPRELFIASFGIFYIIFKTSQSEQGPVIFLTNQIKVSKEPNSKLLWGENPPFLQRRFSWGIFNQFASEKMSKTLKKDLKIV